MRIDAHRLAARLDDLGKIGGGVDGQGCTRLALTEEDRAGRDIVSGWMREAGADVHVDAIGNIHGVLRGAGDALPVMTGSHIDTVRRAGALDGCYGVIAGIEVMDAIRTSGITPRRSLIVSVFTNEEGIRYTPDLLGSRVMAKETSLDAALRLISDDGAQLGEELRRIGYAGELDPSKFLPGVFLELHIEQGPMLDAKGVQIGIVEGVQGYSWWTVRVTGRANHAGTTPMAMRRDAAIAAMETINGLVGQSTRNGIPNVVTAGTFSIESGAINVVPGKAAFTLDMRDSDDENLARAESLLNNAIGALRIKGFDVDAKCVARHAAVRFNESLCEQIGNAAKRLSVASLRMVSGANHDAQMMARVCPSAMIFVPSRDGTSHDPNEFSNPEHLAIGAEVLLETIRELIEA